MITNLFPSEFLSLLCGGIFIIHYTVISILAFKVDRGVVALQGLNPTIPFRADDVNCAKNQIFGEVSKEAGAGADMNGGTKNSTAARAAGNDLVFVNNVLSARSAALGTFNLYHYLLFFFLFINTCVLNTFRFIPACILLFLSSICYSILTLFDPSFFMLTIENTMIMFFLPFCFNNIYILKK